MMPMPATPAGPRDILWQAAQLLPRMAGTTVTGGDVIQALVTTAAQHFPSPDAAMAAAEEALGRLGSYVLIQCESVSPTLHDWLDGCATRTAAWAMKAAADQPTLEVAG
jgi:hypothetical protein